MTNMKSSTHAILALAISLTACKGADSPTGECLSYSCDAAGAKAMMWATVDAAYQPSESAKATFGTIIDESAKKMESGDQGFTPETFELARGNLKKFLDEIPEGGEDPLGPAATDLKNKSSKLCPLWPYC